MMFLACFNPLFIQRDLVHCKVHKTTDLTETPNLLSCNGFNDSRGMYNFVMAIQSVISSLFLNNTRDLL